MPGERQAAPRRGRDLASCLDDAQRAIADKVQYDPARFQIAWGGQFENQQRAQARLLVIMPMVVALMFVLLFAQFRNLRQPTFVLMTAPLGALGGLIALYLRGMTLNVSSAVGFIALFGVSVMDGILMVSNINRLRLEGLPLRDAVLQGARERLRPVLMTASVAALGLLPAALAHVLAPDPDPNMRPRLAQTTTVSICRKNAITPSSPERIAQPQPQPGRPAHGASLRGAVGRRLRWGNSTPQRTHSISAVECV